MTWQSKACLFPLAVATLIHLPDAYAVETMTFRVGRQDIASMQPEQDIGRQRFEENWGQFEVHVPKARFPMPAPNCRKTVILRMTGADPHASASAQALAFRWALFQSLQAVSRGERDHVDVTVEIGPYQRINKRGQRELEYCNAFIPEKQ